MPEKLLDKLLKASCVLHWLGKHEEANALILFSRELRCFDVDTLEKLDVFVSRHEAEKEARERPSGSGDRAGKGIEPCSSS